MIKRILITSLVALLLCVGVSVYAETCYTDCYYIGKELHCTTTCYDY